MYTDLQRIQEAYRNLHSARNRVSDSLKEALSCLDRDEPNVELAINFIIRSLHQIQSDIQR